MSNEMLTQVSVVSLTNRTSRSITPNCIKTCHSLLYTCSYYLAWRLKDKVPGQQQTLINMQHKNPIQSNPNDHEADVA